MSVVYVPDQKGKPPTSPAQVQKMLDENNKMMQAIVEFQNMGRAAECHQLIQVLHRNMIFLASIADAVPSLLPSHPIQINLPSTSQQIPANIGHTLTQGLQTQPSNEIPTQNQIILPNEGNEAPAFIPGIAPLFVPANQPVVVLPNQVMVPSQEVNEMQPQESGASQSFGVVFQPSQEVQENQPLETAVPQTFDVILQPSGQELNGSQSHECGTPQTFDVLLQPTSQEINRNQPCESGVPQTFDVILQPPTGLSQ